MCSLTIECVLYALTIWHFDGKLRLVMEQRMFVCGKTDLIYGKWDLQSMKKCTKETYKVWKSVQKRPAKYDNVWKRGLQSMKKCTKETYKVWKSVQKRPAKYDNVWKRGLQSMKKSTKETYNVWKSVQKWTSCLRHSLQKKPTKWAKETYKVCKRDLQSLQKRPTKWLTWVELVNRGHDHLESEHHVYRPLALGPLHSLMCVCTYMHTHTHTHTHTHMHSIMSTTPHPPTFALPCVCVYIHAYTYTHTHIRTCIASCLQPLTLRPLHCLVCVCTYMHTHTHTHTCITSCPWPSPSDLATTFHSRY